MTASNISELGVCSLVVTCEPCHNEAVLSAYPSGGGRLFKNGKSVMLRS